MSHAQNTAISPVDTTAGMPPPHTRDVINFPKGVPGFEACRSFVLMAPEGETALQCLRAVDGPPATFLVMDPRLVLSGYRCELSDGDRERLHADAQTPLLWLVLVTVETDGTIVANLRAPVVINPQRMLGAQVIPHHCVYPVRHVLVPAE
jgi:flagellar assembly factor FliW